MHYDETALEARVNAALKVIRRVLDNTRHPQYPADVPHKYDDKYMLAEVATRTAIASILQSLEVLGLTGEQLHQLQTWAKTRAVTIRLVAQEDCRFLRETSRKVESGTERVTETRGILGKSTKTEKVITTIVEYFWGFDFKYQIIAFQGTAQDQAITVHQRNGNIEIKTTTNSTPRSKTVVRDAIDLDLTWLLAHAESFAIDRTKTDCHTPRRNADIEKALVAIEEIAMWAANVGRYFHEELFPAQQDHGRDLSAIDDEEVFVPVQPLFESEQLDTNEGLLPKAYTNAFLAEEQRSLAEKCRALTTVFPRDSSVITAVEAGLLVTLMHIARVCIQYSNTVDYIEGMLRKQLVAAIGKELTPNDFTAYMEFHARKLLKPEELANVASYPPGDPKLSTFRDVGDVAVDVDKLITDLKAKSSK